MNKNFKIWGSEGKGIGEALGVAYWVYLCVYVLGGGGGYQLLPFATNQDCQKLLNNFEQLRIGLPLLCTQQKV